MLPLGAPVNVNEPLNVVVKLPELAPQLILTFEIFEPETDKVKLFRFSPEQGPDR